MRARGPSLPAGGVQYCTACAFACAFICQAIVSSSTVYTFTWYLVLSHEYSISSQYRKEQTKTNAKRSYDTRSNTGEKDRLI